MTSWIFSRNTTDILILACLVLSVLWRGGKSLDTTWVFIGICFFVTLQLFLKVISKSDKEESYLKIPWLEWSILLFFSTATLISYLFSTTANYGLDELLRTISFLLLFGWVATRFNNPEQVLVFSGRFSAVITSTALIACGIGVFVYVLQPVNRFVGTFFDYRFHTDYWPNAWAEFLLICWPLSVWFLFSKREKSIPFLVQTGVMGLFFCCLILSYSRGAFIALIGQIILGGLFLFAFKQKPAGIKNISSAVLAAAIIACGLFWGINHLRSSYFHVQSVQEKVTFTAAEGTSSINERSSFWEQSLSLSRYKPLTGYGLYSFRFIQPQLQNKVLATSDHPHNLFLKLILERGWPAAFFLLLFLLLILFKNAKIFLYYLKNKNDPGLSLQWLSFKAAALIAVLGLIAHNFIDYNLQFVGISLPFWLLLGLLAVDNQTDRQKNTGIFYSLQFVISVILITIALREGFYLFTSSVARHAQANNQPQKAIEYYIKSSPQWFSRDSGLSLAQLYFNQKDYQSAQQTLDDYLKINSEDARAWVIQAKLYHEQEQYQNAFDFYQKAYQRNRYNDLSPVLGLMEAAILLNNQQLIDSHKKEIDQLLKEYLTAVENNTHFISLSANIETAVTLAYLLADIYPADAANYEVIAAKINYKAKLDRAEYVSRPPGFLW